MASDSNTAKFDGRCLLRLYLLMIITLIRLRPAAGELHAVKHVRFLYISRVLTDHLANEINPGPRHVNTYVGFAIQVCKRTRRKHYSAQENISEEIGRIFR